MIRRIDHPIAVVAAAAAAAVVVAAVAKRRKREEKPRKREAEPRAPMDRAQLPSSPYTLLVEWMHEAEATEGIHARAMVLATGSAAQGPTARSVNMLRADADSNEIIFGTNPSSLKGRQMALDQRVEAVFRWGDRQVRVRGEAMFDGGRELTAAAYRDLPRGAQLSLRVASQGKRVSDEEHASAVEQVRELVAGQQTELEPPPSYAAARIKPTSIEFYQGAGVALGYINHDRFLYVHHAKEGQWATHRLQA